MRKDGSLGKLSVKWFGADVTRPAKCRAGAPARREPVNRAL
ncbi:hypothetical protein ACU4HD_02165 [Cupriavidus basilensis]